MCIRAPLIVLLLLGAGNSIVFEVLRHVDTGDISNRKGGYIFDFENLVTDGNLFYSIVKTTLVKLRTVNIFSMVFSEFVLCCFLQSDRTGHSGHLIVDKYSHLKVQSSPQSFSKWPIIVFV